MMTVFQEGIDVSRYQGVVDWSAVAAAGKQFAIVRLGSSNQSGPYVDPYFTRNVQGAHDAGLRVGAYFYTYGKTESQVIRELDVFLKALEGHRLEYPVYVDAEDASLAGLGRESVTRLLQFSMDILDQKGWFPGYYSYTEFLRRYVNTQQLTDYPLWVADYRGYVGHGGSYGMWQYSSVGQVNGVSGNVDLNYSYVDYLPLIQQAGKNGYLPQAQPTQPGQDYYQLWRAAQDKLDRIGRILAEE